MIGFPSFSSHGLVTRSSTAVPELGFFFRNEMNAHSAMRNTIAIDPTEIPAIGPAPNLLLLLVGFGIGDELDGVELDWPYVVVAAT